MNDLPVIAERQLSARSSTGVVTLDVRIFLPRRQGSGPNWQCQYEIQWSDAIRRNSVGGVDSVQALSLALQFIGAELYAGRPSELADLTWLEPEAGFGFPLPPNLRDLAVGEDKRL